MQITQNTTGVPGASERDDSFGGGPAVVDPNRDGLADIVMGSPYEDLTKADAGRVTAIPGRRSGALGTGAVWVLPGGASRPTATGSRLFTAPSAGLTQADSTLLGGNGLLWIV
ncbi:FG-GAP repeat protein [Streptomyces lincolnensis]|uniref:FG-GAP repeat protein n=1 Tax=Streptomyces lincolnensis TaxID=1915 RepID=UPI0037D1F342